MKKVFSVFMCAVLAAVCSLAFAGCSNAENLTYDIVMITDGGTVADGAYNESAWSGIVDYVENANTVVSEESKKISYRYYQPYVEEDEELSTETALQYIDLAVEKGAKFIILPGEVFEVAAFEASRQYSNVDFILVDGTPHPENSDIDAYIENVMCVSFDSLESGFLAGYYAVLSGNTKLGYFGSVNSENSGSYGAGFVQGAQYAAEQLGIPVTMDYADYDSPLLDYNYDFTLTANYKKIDEQSEKTFVVKVENGTGSGTYTEGQNVTVKADPAPEGQVFDHWDYKSNTQGVKDSKVNLSTETGTETNLLVEECDCTITAVYRDAESTTYPVIVKNTDGSDYSAQYIMAGDSCNVVAPVAESGMVFDHWEISTLEPDAIDDIQAKDTWVHVSDATQGITLTPVYVENGAPTFNVTVVTGEGGNGESTGSGSYVANDVVSVSAAVPQEGYIFSHWSTADEDGFSTDIVMENEYFPTTTYTMVNRYQAVVEKMYNEGVSVVYAGGNPECNAVSDATWNYSFDKLAIGAENWQSGWDHYISTSVKDYGSAVKACLQEFKGGYTYVGDCSNNGIYLTNIDVPETEPETEQEKAQLQKANEIKAAYDEVYAALASGEISPTDVAPGADVRLVVDSNCFTLDYWIANGDPVLYNTSMAE